MSNVGFETQLKNNTIFQCNVSYVQRPAQYTFGKKKLEIRGQDNIKL